MVQATRVRYAPSPTGHLHIGNARTALFNYLFARNQQGEFIVRIEDTDLKRNIPGGEESQLKFMKWLGIDWDESIDKPGKHGSYRQTERLDIYKKYWQQLIDQGLAYKCYCSEEELEQEREEQFAKGLTPKYSGKHRNLTLSEQLVFEGQGLLPSIRFKVPEQRAYRFNDIVKGDVSFDSEGLGDFVIVKKDGIPTYNFAVVIDDHEMEISHVLRGDDHLSNTPRQLMIYEALNWEPPTFGHMTLIVNEQHKKLSKRDESIIQFIEQYHDLGYLPEALFNFIALLGWSPVGETEIFSADELVEVFDTERLSKSPAVFDSVKLKWMNNEYIKKAEPARIISLAIPHLQKAGLIPKELDHETETWVAAMVTLLQDKLSYVAEIVELSEMFFKAQPHYDQESKEMLAEESAPLVLKSFLQQIENIDEISVDQIKACIKAVQQETGYKGKSLFMGIRAALTGQIHGPDLNQTLYLLGKEKIISRLQKII